MTSPIARKIRDPHAVLLLKGTDYQPRGPHSGRNVHSSTCGGGEFRERPILFSGEMVRAILDGKKTQTRRIVKPQPWSITAHWPSDASCVLWQDVISKPDYYGQCGYCPHGQPGDQLWVREAFGYAPASLPSERAVSYRIDTKTNGWQPVRFDWAGLTVWRPSIHMPRWASRITLEIVSVRVERLQEITEDDAKAEGVIAGPCGLFDCGVVKPNGYPECLLHSSAKDAYSHIWDSINGKRPGCSWTDNPWVWVIEFRRVKP